LWVGDRERGGELAEMTQMDEELVGDGKPFAHVMQVALIATDLSEAWVQVTRATFATRPGIRPARGRCL
jgi:hypothetical protein